MDSISDASCENYIDNVIINPDTFFDDMIGVTKDINAPVHKVRFRASAQFAPYIETKPLHSSQFIVERDEDGAATFQMEVVLNPELEKDLLGFGEGIKVLSPSQLADSISKRLRAAAGQYRL
ncbi:MAG: WYL domain-containing protein [Bacteroidales bacterium]|nr:WYL domain-containing protein [Bacteroidales bacterium]